MAIWRDLRTEMRALRTEMRHLRTEMRADVRQVETRLSDVEKEQAEVKGIVAGPAGNHCPSGRPGAGLSETRPSA